MRKPSVPCSVCGELMWQGTGSLAPGVAAHRACKRVLCYTVELPPTFRCERCGVECERVVGRGRRTSRCARCSRTRRNRFAPSQELRLRIYQRDGWTCQLCMEPVDQNAHYMDDWAPSLDHVECQSWALVPDHSESNLRTAHRWCNSARSDDRYNTSQFLVA